MITYQLSSTAQRLLQLHETIPILLQAETGPSQRRRLLPNHLLSDVDEGASQMRLVHGIVPRLIELIPHVPPRAPAEQGPGVLVCQIFSITLN